MEVNMIRQIGFAGGVITFVYMAFVFCNCKLYKLLLDFTKYNVRYHVIMIVVKAWVDLDLVPNIVSTTRTFFNGRPC